MHLSTTWKRILLSCAATGAVLLPATMVSAQTITIKSGDTLGKLGVKHHLSVNHLKIANHLTTDEIIVGNKLYIPPQATAIHQIENGDTLWILANKYHTTVSKLMEINRLTDDTLIDGQKILVPSVVHKKSKSNKPAGSKSDKPWVEYARYTVKGKDTAWTISIDHKIPMTEFLQANHLSESDLLMDGQVVKIPVHHIPVTKRVGQKYGEYVDWYSQAQYLFPINQVATVTDFATGKQFRVKRTIGANHSDTEPLTAADAVIMKKIWGGQFSWKVRPVIVEVNGRKLAASMSSMPHSIEYIGDNDFPGHFDIHFRNSLRHKDQQIDPDHRAAIRIAAGLSQ